MRLTEANNPRIIGHQRTTSLYRGRDQQPVCLVAVFETVQTVCTRGRAMVQRQHFHAGPIREAFDPGFERLDQFDPATVNKLRDLPHADRTEQDGAAVPPAILD
jgi:hypothetical protein